MKYQKGDHLQVIGSNIHGIVADAEDLTFKAQVKSMQQHWYLLENDIVEYPQLIQLVRPERLRMEFQLALGHPMVLQPQAIESKQGLV